MKLTETPIKDLIIIEPRVFEDNRGYFFESYNKSKLNKEGIRHNFVQDNESRSGYGTVRGLHYQMEPKAQTKLVRVLSGTILDIAVDIRKDSPSYGKWFGIELSGENKKQLLIPKGFAHGFSVLSEIATVFYKCDEFYAPEYDAGIIYNDPFLGIDWKIPGNKIILSEKDSKLPGFGDAKNNFKF
ncbi:MAG: dTDP-4-dehydrorhamnose 3,5-epimerase [Bacteroidales bacterium]|jgi:dTDP-4-dehydrorhamnose 3,5-epimerase